MQVLPQCGHAVHEDAPEKVSSGYEAEQLLVKCVVVSHFVAIVISGQYVSNIAHKILFSMSGN